MFLQLAKLKQSVSLTSSFLLLFLKAFFLWTECTLELSSLSLSTLSDILSKQTLPAPEVEPNVSVIDPGGGGPHTRDPCHIPGGTWSAGLCPIMGRIWTIGDEGVFHPQTNCQVSGFPHMHVQFCSNVCNYKVNMQMRNEVMSN